MANALNIDMFFTQVKPSARARCLAIMDAFDKVLGAPETPWRRLKVDGGSSTFVSPTYASTVEDARQRIESVIEDPLLFISIDTVFPLARTQNFSDEVGNVGISCYGPAYGLISRGEERLREDVHISLTPVSPFVASGKADHDAAAEANTQLLMTLILRIIDTLCPTRLTVTQDIAAPLSFNSHCVYFSSFEEVVSDLRFIHHMWTNGIHRWQPAEPPLAWCDPRKRQFVFSPLRTADMRQRMFEDFGRLLPVVDNVTTSDVSSVLKSKKFDFFDRDLQGENGICVLDFPFFVNTLLDEFYLGVLREASRRVDTDRATSQST